MEISIENFRHYTTKRVFNFEQSLNLLRGSSGSGKSTICAAITWCLYNKPSTKNKPFTKTSKSVICVSVKIDNLKITRENPGDLVVLNTKTQTEIKGDSAQILVSSVFGDYLTWTSCSYMGQNTKNPIISSSANDKYTIINSLMHGDDINTKIMQSTTMKIAEKTREFDKLSDKISFLSGKLKDTTETDFSLPEIELKIKKYKEYYFKAVKDKAINDSNLKRKTDILNQLDELYLKRSENLRSTEFIDEFRKNLKLQEIENEKYAQLQELTKQFKKLGVVPSNYEELIDKLSVLVSNTKSYLKATDGYDDIDQVIEYEKKREQLIKDNEEAEIQNLKLKMEFETLTHKAKLQLQELKHEREILLKTTKEYSKYVLLKSKHTKFKKMKNPQMSLEEIFEKINELKSSKLNLICPACDAEVHLRDSELFPGRQINISEKLETLNKLKLEHHEYNQLESELKDFDSENTISDPSEEIEEINLKIKSLNKTLDEELILNKIKKVPVSLKHIISVQKPEKLASEEDAFLLEQAKKGPLYFDLKSKIEKLGNPKFKDTSFVVKTLNKIEQLNSELEGIPKIKTDTDSYLQNVELNLEKYQALKQKQTEYEENLTIKEEHKMYTDRFQQVSNEIKNNKDLKELTERAWFQTFQTITDTFSFYLNDFLQYVFDDPIEIRLKTQKQSKNQVHCEIKYAGTTLENFLSFSGGELDRISLGLTLAFAKIQNSKILILDEVMSSLNEDLRDRCLRQIKKYNMTVIHICHETVEGYHSNVIDLTTCC